jgi:hypothetical protein
MPTGDNNIGRGEKTRFYNTSRIIAGRGAIFPAQPNGSGASLFDSGSVQFKPVIHQPVAQFLGHPLLQVFDFFVVEFDDFTAFDIDQVVVMIFRDFLVPRTSVAKIVTVQDILLLEKANGPVNRGNTDPGIKLGGSFVDQFNIGMIVGFAQDLRNDAPLPCHLEPLFLA